MGEKIRIGDFGRFVFNFCREKIIKVNGKTTKVKFNDSYDLGGMEVIDTDAKTLLIKGMDKEELIVDRKQVKAFEPEEKPIRQKS